MNRKKARILSMLLALVLLLCACAPQPEPVPEPSPAPDPVPEPVPTPVPDPEPDIPAQPDTPEPPTPELPSATPVIPDPPPEPRPLPLILEAGTPVYTGPDGDYLLTVSETGRYMVADSLTDAAGTNWVQLKSPAGWVNLTAVSAAANDPYILSWTWPGLETDRDPFPENQTPNPVALQARRELRNLRLTTLALGEVLTEDTTLLELDSLTAGTTLLLRISFPGSSSVYGLSFTDDTGTQYRLTLSESGKDSSLFVGEY